MNDTFIDISRLCSLFDDNQLEHRQCLDSSSDYATRCRSSTNGASIGGSQSPPRAEVDPFELLPPDVVGSAENRLWETVRRAEVSFNKHGRASRRFHQAKRGVDQTLGWFSAAEQHPRPSPSPSPSLVVEERGPGSDDEEDSPSAQVVAFDTDRRNSSSLSCPGRDARLKAGEAQIAPIIDAMEARAARVEQLADEMERLFIDAQNLLYQMTRYR